ncbi:MAG TPA: LLM class F420-dependent oxidoreductase [Candidatus Binataceae bacterium]|nr:LLM class F420-dependent oxidoreductase [Candidatus Binataceae bacterium]
MKIGVFLLPSAQSADPAIVARRAEELGFASFWVPEHPILPVHCSSGYPGTVDGSIPPLVGIIADPFVALGRASAVTSKIQLGTGVCLVPERNPLLLAKEIATLDHYSNGRFIFGIGAGWLKEETEIMGGDFAHRWSQTRDAILAMKQLWTKDESEYHGRFYNFPAVRSFPKPAAKPHPPVLLGGSSKYVFKRIVEWGDGWLPTGVSLEGIQTGRATLNELAEKAGRDPQSLTIIAFGQPGQFSKRPEIEALAKAGISHATIWLTRTKRDDVLEELEKLAELLR